MFKNGLAEGLKGIGKKYEWLALITKFPFDLICIGLLIFLCGWFYMDIALGIGGILLNNIIHTSPCYVLLVQSSLKCFGKFCIDYQTRQAESICVSKHAKII